MTPFLDIWVSPLWLSTLQFIYVHVGANLKPRLEADTFAILQMRTWCIDGRLEYFYKHLFSVMNNSDFGFMLNTSSLYE